MSQVTDEILEKLKTLTLLEAAKLVSQLEETFGVDASIIQGSRGRIQIVTKEASKDKIEKKTFDVILESVAEDKRVAALKIIRSLTSLGLKEAKDFCSLLPKVVKRDISKEEAEETKNSLEEAGGKVTVQ